MLGKIRSDISYKFTSTYSPIIKTTYRYTSLRPTSLSNVIFAAREGIISLIELRAFLAIALLLSKRQAAENTIKRKTKIRFSATQLAKNMGLPVSTAKKAISKLREEGLLKKVGDRLYIANEPLKGSEELLTKLSPTRSLTRPIPVPLNFLNYCINSSAGTIAILIGYLLRGLSIKRQSGQIVSSGRVLIKSLAEFAGISERQASKLRKELISDGLLFDDAERDNPKFFNARQKDGLFFTINTEFGVIKKAKKIPKKVSKEVQAPTSTNEIEKVISAAELVLKESANLEQTILQSEENSEFDSEKDLDKESEINVTSGKVPVSSGKVPVLIKDFDLSSKEESKRPGSDISGESLPSDANTEEVASRYSGVCNASKRGGEDAPNIHNVRAKDLEDIFRTEKLYIQAVQKGFLSPTEANAINFIAAAIRAKTAKTGDSPKIFMGILRGKLWHHITQANEERALAELKHYRKRCPGLFQAQEVQDKKANATLQGTNADNRLKDLMATLMKKFV